MLKHNDKHNGKIEEEFKTRDIKNDYEYSASVAHELFMAAITCFYRLRKMYPGPKSFPRNHRLTSRLRPRAKKRVSRPSSIDLNTSLLYNPKAHIMTPM